MRAKLLTFRTLTPLHVGSGTSVSYIDLPIARERHTDYPVIPGSGIKGVIRDVATRKNVKNPCSVENVFGPEPGKDEHRASLVAFTDAKILFYPVRSLRGVFALITSPYVLRRFAEDMRAAEAMSEDWKIPKKLEEIIRWAKTAKNGSHTNNSQGSIKDDIVIVAQDSVLLLSKRGGNEEVVLEEFNFSASKEDFKEDFNKILEIFRGFNILTDEDVKRIAIVSNDVFRDMVKYAVEVRTRIRIDQAKGTVEGGALFSLEMVPAEAIFYSFVFTKSLNNGSSCDDKKAMEFIEEILPDDSVLQVGGDETVGLGFVKVKTYSPPSKTEDAGGEDKGPSNGTTAEVKDE